MEFLYILKVKQCAICDTIIAHIMVGNVTKMIFNNKMLVALSLITLFIISTFNTSALAQTAPVIDVWYGLDQDFGHLGNPQPSDCIWSKHRQLILSRSIIPLLISCYRNVPAVCQGSD